MAFRTTLREGRVYKFHSQALPDDTLRVVSFQGRERISQPYRFELELISAADNLDALSVLRSRATLAIKQGYRDAEGRRSAQELPIHGALQTFDQSEKVQDWVRYRAVLVPRMARLGLVVRSRIFQDLSAPEIVLQVLDESGLRDDDVQVRLSDRNYPKREYVAQYQESDLQFVSRLLEHEGISYWFEQEIDREILVIADRPEAHPQVPELPYRPVAAGAWQERAGDWFDAETVVSLTSRTTVMPSEVRLDDYNYRTPRVELEAREPAGQSGFGSTSEIGDHFKDEAEGDALARVRAEEVRCREGVFFGTSDGRALRAGGRFALTGHYRFNESYLVTEVRHKGQQEFGNGTIGAGYENEFSAIPSRIPYRPERKTPRPRITGTIHARVEGTDGPYAELDDQGRYKVRFVFDRESTSRWMRMAQPYAGAGYGMHFPLHPGTEVVVAHVNGDPDRPFILSALPNPDTKSPVVNENQTQCVIHSAGNNMIRLDDQEDHEKFFLHAQKNMDVRIRGNEREWVGYNRHLIVRNDQFERVHGERHEQVEKNHFELIKGDRNLGVMGSQRVGIGGMLSLRVDGDATAMFGANHTQEALGDATIKAMNLILQADQSVSIVCGGSEIVLDAAGVTIKGGAVTIDGGQTKINSGPGTPALAAVPAEAEAPAPPGEALAPGSVEIERPSVEDPERRRSWIGVHLKDEAGRDVPGALCWVKDSTGRIFAKWLDREGRARFEGVEPGTCQICFPEIDGEEWRPA